jgi:NAD(P)-dependent dehydrogenase (short-subunit alcohol dehydrogenase family)
VQSSSNDPAPGGARRPLIHLEGKAALVTGGSRGIGLAIARAYAAAGARVAIAARKPEGLAEAKATLAAEGLEVETFPCHVGRTDEAKKLVADVASRLGRIDVLVNNAATNPHFGPMITADEALFDKTFEVNARAYFTLAREVAQHVVGRGGGASFVFVTSIQGLHASPLMGIYGMTKAAVVSLTQTLAVELGPSGIRVNAIAPGIVETRFAKALTSNDVVRGKYLDRTPLRRVGAPDDVAGVALLLASDAAAYVTGETIVVDGGYTISA